MIMNMGSSLYAIVKTITYMPVKKLNCENCENFIKVIKWLRCIIINTNFPFHLSLYLFISIYFNISLLFENYSIFLIKFSLFNL
jgi:hypothetical protein